MLIYIYTIYCEVQSLIFINNSLIFNNVFPDDLNVISRAQWGAREPKSAAANLRIKPVPNVIIHHSTGPGCETQANCQLKVKNIQVINTT